MEHKTGLEDYYVIRGQKKMRFGYTTGSCAAAACKGACLMLLGKEKLTSVPLMTPKGILLSLIKFPACIQIVIHIILSQWPLHIRSQPILFLQHPARFLFLPDFPSCFAPHIYSFQIFHGALPDCHSFSKSCISRWVSMHCQKPSW